MFCLDSYGKNLPKPRGACECWRECGNSAGGCCQRPGPRAGSSDTTTIPGQQEEGRRTGEGCPAPAQRWWVWRGGGCAEGPALASAWGLASPRGLSCLSPGLGSKRSCESICCPEPPPPPAYPTPSPEALCGCRGWGSSGPAGPRDLQGVRWRQLSAGPHVFLSTHPPICPLCHMDPAGPAVCSRSIGAGAWPIPGRGRGTLLAGGSWAG